MDWNPDQYAKFNSAREAPFLDLLSHVARRPSLRVVDLGCGPGNLTRKLADALAGSDVTGIDSSPAMLARAAGHARPGLRFAAQTIEEFAASDERYDLVFSNAALHWVHDHEQLIPRLVGKLSSGGQIVVQMPSDDYNPMRVIFAEAAGWRHKMGTLDIAAYADLLWRSGAHQDMLVYEKVYCHELPDADAILEWMRGTTLLPYLERAADPDALIAEVRTRFRREFPGSPVMFGFRRTLLAAARV